MYQNSLKSAVIKLVKISQPKHEINFFTDANVNKMMITKNHAYWMAWTIQVSLYKCIEEVINNGFIVLFIKISSQQVSLRLCWIRNTFEVVILI